MNYFVTYLPANVGIEKDQTMTAFLTFCTEKNLANATIKISIFICLFDYCELIFLQEGKPRNKMDIAVK